MKEIDVEKIMSEIRKDIKAKNYEETAFDFNSIKIKTIDEIKVMTFNINELKNSLSFLTSNWGITPFCTLQGTGIKLFIKKAIRKIVRPSFIQNFDSQKRFNEKVAQALTQMIFFIEELDAKIKGLEEGRK